MYIHSVQLAGIGKHLKYSISPDLGCSILSDHVNPQIHLVSGRQAVDVPQSQPKFPRHVPKPILVLCPRPCEVLSASRQSSLNDYPSTSVCLHITVDQLFTAASCSRLTHVTDFKEITLLRGHKVAYLVSGAKCDGYAVNI